MSCFFWLDQAPSPWETMHNILLVVVGSIVGVLARFIGRGNLRALLGLETGDFVTALIGAVMLVVLHHAAVLRRTAR